MWSAYISEHKKSGRLHITVVSSDLPGISLSTVLLRQLLGIDVREERGTDGTRSSPHHVELVESLRGQDNLEGPEHPGHDRRDVDKELDRLLSHRVSADCVTLGERSLYGLLRIRDSDSGKCW